MEEKKGTAEIILILDKSGSMSGTESDTVGGFNALIEKQKNLVEQAWVTAWFFNSHAQLLYDRVPINEVKPMSETDFSVGGCTALYDTVGKAIERAELIQKHIRSEDIPDLTMVAIMTDGYENASRQYNNQSIRKLIEKKKADGWEFLFMAAGIDAKEEAEKIAIDNSFHMETNQPLKAFVVAEEFIQCKMDERLPRKESRKRNPRK